MNSFADFARAHGLLIDRLIADGRIHRCATVGRERRKNGAYMLDRGRGWVHAWDQDGVTHYFNDPDSKPWSEAEKRALHEQRLARYRQQEQRHKRAADEAAAMLKRAEWLPAAYMSYKGFKERLARHAKPEWRHGYAHMVDGAMFIPMYSLGGDIVGAQLIRWLPDEGVHEKKMLPGTRAKGAVFRFGNPKAANTWLVEGFCTGLSVKMALDQMRFPDSVLVAFSDSNMVHVAPQVPGRNFVFADNDKSGAGERAAKATGLPYCMAPEVGDDANDLHQKAGIFAVQGLIQRARAG